MIRHIALIAAWSGLALSAAAQTSSAQSTASARLEVTLAYSADRTNGVVGGCGCFWLAGGRAEASSFERHGISVIAELAGEHTNSINSAHEGLSFVSYLFGPRFAFPPRSRMVLFGQFLAGGVHGFDALFPNTNGSNVVPDAFAFAAGGGINVRLSRKLALRAVQADYLQTRLPNSTNNQQNHLRISGGIVFRFGESSR